MRYDRTVGIPNGFMNKLSEGQKIFIQSAVGLRFYDEFLCGHGKHLFIFGLTGAGKTNKGYAFIDWLKHLETQVWFDSGKQGEILPLLCQGLNVRIITPAGTDILIEENKNGKWEKIPNHPEVIRVSNPGDAISSIHPGTWSGSRHRIRDTITIISFRNGFSKKEMAVSWVAEFFERLADRCRHPGEMPKIMPAAIHVDESQWAITGKRVSGEGERTKASEAITENALELRSSKIRLVLYAQSYKNIPPAARENMLFNLICHGGRVSSDENPNISKWCFEADWRSPISPMKYETHQGRFVFENGDSYPPTKPWNFPVYPIRQMDRKWIEGLRVRYEGRYDTRTEEREQQEELSPDLGRFSAMAIPPAEREVIINRWGSEQVGRIEE